MLLTAEGHQETSAIRFFGVVSGPMPANPNITMNGSPLNPSDHGLDVSPFAGENVVLSITFPSGTYSERLDGIAFVPEPSGFLIWLLGMISGALFVWIRPIQRFSNDRQISLLRQRDCSLSRRNRKGVDTCSRHRFVQRIIIIEGNVGGIKK